MRENIWGRAKSSFNTNQTRPGQHGARGKKPTDFGLQLMAKQKLKGYYANIGEKQFRTIFKKASNMKGDTAQNLIGLLESRLDAIIYRMKFVPTPFAARQFVNHCHILVNGKRVNIPSYVVKPGDTIEIREKSKSIPMVLEAMQSAERSIPDYLSVDEAHPHKGKYVRTPTFEEVPYPVRMEPNLVIEFYSR